MPEGPITLSVVSHGQGDLVRRLLACVERYCGDTVGHVIVTLNLPEPWADAPLLAHPRRTVICNPVPKGFAANHNAAFRVCETPFFAVVNPDIHFEADPFAALSETLVSAQVALAVPTVLESDGRRADDARALVTPLDLVRRHLLGFKASPRADWYAGMFMLLRSAAFARVGGFDAGYFLYCEDVDLCARLRLDGWQLCRNPAVMVTHDAQRTSRWSWRYTSLHVRSLVRWWTSATFRHYRALLRSEAREIDSR